MKFTLEITCDNAAFGEGDDGEAPELARILRDLADRFEQGAYFVNDETPVRDINGNRVGFWELRG